MIFFVDHHFSWQKDPKITDNFKTTLVNPVLCINRGLQKLATRLFPYGKWPKAWIKDVSVVKSSLGKQSASKKIQHNLYHHQHQQSLFSLDPPTPVICITLEDLFLCKNKYCVFFYHSDVMVFRVNVKMSAQVKTLVENQEHETIHVERQESVNILLLCIYQL